MFKLGRGHESDLRINDISVSRCHAKIKLEKGKFMLEDNTSKFGTLVLVKQRTPLLPLYNKAVQVGRTVINFSVKLIGRYVPPPASRQQRQTIKKTSQKQDSFHVYELYEDSEELDSSGDDELDAALDKQAAKASMSSKQDRPGL